MRRRRHRGIPTWYRSVRYRSRQEARWACFFDFLGWKHDYEPIDLDGWIPDFALTIPGQSTPFLAECKPALAIQDLFQHVAKIEAAAKDQRVLLLGARWGKTLGLWLPHGIEFGLAPCAAGIGIGWETPEGEVGEMLRRGWVSAGNQVQWRKP